MHLYQQVETQIMEMIDNGLLNPGDKLPSLRRLSIRMNLSLSTINQAYLELEKKGLISARARSGFYVRQGLKRLPKLQAPRPSKAQAQPVGRAQIIDQVLSSINQPEMLPLGLAYPEENLLPVKQLSRIAIGVLKEKAGKALGYGSVQGDSELRRQIAFRSVDWGPVLAPGQIITTFGALDAIGIALRSLTRPGDNVLIASPCYYGFLMLLASLGLKAVEVPNHPEHGLPMDQVEQTLKRLPIKAVLISSNFNNPDGAIIPGESKKELVRILARREIPLIEDDIYGEIFTGSARPRSCKAHDKNDLVISCGSFSKTLAPGYRVGWIAAGAHTSRMLRTKSALNPYCASFNQMVLAEFLRQGSMTGTFPACGGRCAGRWPPCSSR
jgi:DNA-binding transcriptional MocR family regulator